MKGTLELAKEMTPGEVPSSFSNVCGSAFSEITGKGIERFKKLMAIRNVQNSFHVISNFCSDSFS